MLSFRSLSFRPTLSLIFDLCSTIRCIQTQLQSSTSLYLFRIFVLFFRFIFLHLFRHSASLDGRFRFTRTRTRSSFRPRTHRVVFAPLLLLPRPTSFLPLLHHFRSVASLQSLSCTRICISSSSSSSSCSQSLFRRLSCMSFHSTGESLLVLLLAIIIISMCLLLSFRSFSSSFECFKNCRHH
jgi:hypothetical protein